MLSFFLVFSLCPVTDISETMAPMGVKFCMMAHVDPEQVFSVFFWGGGHCPQGIPKIRNFATKFWPFDREYLEVEALYVN